MNALQKFKLYINIIIVKLKFYLFLWKKTIRNK